MHVPVYGVEAIPYMAYYGEVPQDRVRLVFYTILKTKF